MCKPCFEKLLKDGNENICTIVDPSRRTFVLLWPSKAIMAPREVLSISGTIYAFDHKEDAEKCLSQLRALTTEDLSGVTTLDVSAAWLLEYAMSRADGVKVIGVERWSGFSSRSAP